LQKDQIHRIVLLVLLAIATIVVLIMVQNFGLVIFLSALSAALASPINKSFLKLFKQNRGIAATSTVITLVIGVLIPLSIVLGMFVNQAYDMKDIIQPKIQELVSNRTAIDDLIDRIPYGDKILEYQDVIVEKAGEAVGKVSGFAYEKLQSFTFSAINSLFLFFLYLYALFFFIKDGRVILDKFLYYLPLRSKEENLLLERFTSVAKATLKGTLLIGAIQGILAGVAMWIAGIETALFWSVIMMILSVIPVIGTILVWLPAGIILIATGSVVPGVLLLVWCGVVVGNIDNVLRPVLVGQESGLHELIILFSTLGGLTLFGVTGFIVGPIVAALCVTLWEIYGELFQDYLPPVIRAGASNELNGSDDYLETDDYFYGEFESDESDNCEEYNSDDSEDSEDSDDSDDSDC